MSAADHPTESTPLPTSADSGATRPPASLGQLAVGGRATTANPPNEGPGPAPLAPVISLRRDGIPAELAARDQWVTWRLEARRGGAKPQKVPYNARTGARASHSDPATWSSFDAALAACTTRGHAGIGFVFSEGDPYVGIDLDHARDPRTGEVAPWARELLAEFGSYAEVSQSGTGVHIVGRGRLPGKGRKRRLPDSGGKVEVYDRTRFFALTGERLDWVPHGIAEAQGHVLRLYERLGSARTASGGIPVPRGWRTDDEAVLARARAAKNGAKFTALYDGGDLKPYGGDDSAADQALANMLAYWSGDADQVDRLFRGSALMRDKWDEMHGDQTYGAMTIEKAFDGGGPGKRRTPSTQRGRSAHQAALPGQPSVRPLDNRKATVLDGAGGRVEDLERRLAHAERQLAEQAHLHSLLFVALANPNLGVATRIVGILAINELASAASRGIPGPVPLYREALAEGAGMSPSTVGKSLADLVSVGVLRKTVRYERKQARDAKGVARPRFHRVASYELADDDPADSLRRIASAERPAHRRRHGGARPPKWPGTAPTTDAPPQTNGKESAHAAELAATYARLNACVYAQDAPTRN